MRNNTHKAISSAFAGLSVCDDDCLLDVAVDREVLSQALVGRVVRESSNEQFGPGCVFLAWQRAQCQQPLGLGRQSARHQHALHSLRRAGHRCTLLTLSLPPLSRSTSLRVARVCRLSYSCKHWLVCGSDRSSWWLSAD